MEYLNTYIYSLSGSFIFASFWVALGIQKNNKFTQSLRALVGINFEFVVNTLIYSVFLFVVMLIVGGAVWLFTLMFVFLPADILQNDFNSSALNTILTEIKPYIRQTRHSPGFLGQPILDYATLSVFVLAPISGIWATINKHRKERLPRSRATA